MTTAVILTGADRYESKWHDHPATSQRLAELMTELDVDARLRATHPRSFPELNTYDLLVVNAGNGLRSEEDATDDQWRDAFVHLDRFIASGKPVVAFHNSVAALTDDLAWTRLLGGEWIRGMTMHPPISQAILGVTDHEHPITAGLGRIDVFDERYSFMSVAGDNTVLVDHEFDGRRHPLVWVREGQPGRVVVDALGHDVRSYDSPSHRRLIRRAFAWALGAPDDEVVAL